MGHHESKILPKLRLCFGQVCVSETGPRQLQDKRLRCSLGLLPEGKRTKEAFKSRQRAKRGDKEMWSKP